MTAAGSATRPKHAAKRWQPRCRRDPAQSMLQRVSRNSVDARRPDPDRRLDVGFTSVDGFPSVRACAEALAEAVGAPASAVDRVVDDRVAAVVPAANFSRYRYLIHLPGAATGSYSRNLQYLFAHGAVVLIWEHAAREWSPRPRRNLSKKSRDGLSTSLAAAPPRTVSESPRRRPRRHRDPPPRNASAGTTRT